MEFSTEFLFQKQQYVLVFRDDLKFFCMIDLSFIQALNDSIYIEDLITKKKCNKKRKF